MRLAHLSDLHFGRGVARKAVDALREDLLAQCPDLVIVTGDVTDRGTVAQFKWAREFLDSLGLPVLSVPGNREICFTAFWEWMFPRFAMSRYSRFFGEPDRIFVRCDVCKTAFFGINSVHPFPSWPGTLSRPTRYWLKEQAAGLHGYRKVLFLHHPVIPVIRSSSFWAHGLSDAGEVLNICSETGIELILQGHKHRSAVVELSVPARNARVVVSAAGAPLRTEWDRAYHIVDLLADAIAVSPRELSGSRFCANGTYRFPAAE
jgi:3',5'-cyclic AMP phosphodiesterase CpdA